MTEPTREEIEVAAFQIRAEFGCTITAARFAATRVIVCLAALHARPALADRAAIIETKIHFTELGCVPVCETRDRVAAVTPTSENRRSEPAPSLANAEWQEKVAVAESRAAVEQYVDHCLHKSGNDVGWLQDRIILSIKNALAALRVPLSPPIDALARVAESPSAPWMTRMDRIEKAARALFEVDQEIARDRDIFKTFDAMPSALQQWWKDRAERKLDELRLLANSGYDPHRDQ